MHPNMKSQRELDDTERPAGALRRRTRRSIGVAATFLVASLVATACGGAIPAAPRAGTGAASAATAAVSADAVQTRSAAAPGTSAPVVEPTAPGTPAPVVEPTAPGGTGRCVDSVSTQVPQPSAAQLAAAGLDKLPVAPIADRVDLVGRRSPTRPT